MSVLELAFVVVDLNQRALSVFSKLNLILVSLQQLLVLWFTFENLLKEFVDEVFHFPVIALFAEGSIFHFHQSFQ